ncbi:MAG TPA: sugar phosphate isomerase/epimerase family protein [Candidatus Lokiarchaeia archaeon]|nr:sugar phosphate isomerase/epimerase family protein [Candidatus Lokiarchaeia archaeon]
MGQKISVLTDEFGEPDFEKVASWLASEGFENVELRNVWVKNVFNIDAIDLDELKNILRENGLSVSSISGGLLKVPWWGPDDEPELMKDGTPVKEYQMRMADNCIAAAVELGAPFIRAFGFSKIAFIPDEAWGDWVQGVKDITAKAEAHDKTIIIENEAGCTVSTIESIQKAFSAVHSDHCKLLLDPGNLFAAGDVFTDEVFDIVKDITAYVHVKDAVVQSQEPYKTAWCITGDGEVGWPDIIKRFIENGYDSYWSIETHMGKKDGWDNTVRNLRALKIMLA